MPVYDLYFLRRFIEEMVLAQTAADEHERAVHLQACRYYGDIMHMNDESKARGTPPASDPFQASSQSSNEAV
jgi:hypothetical protein